MRSFLAAFLLAGCGFSLSPSAGAGLDANDGLAIDASVDDSSAIDAPAPPALAVAHIAAIDEQALTSVTDYPLTGAVVIDTASGTIVPAAPPGVIVRNVAQEGGGLALMVIQARRISVAAGANVRIIGTRGVVFVATMDIVVTGALDASANHITPGPGGHLPQNGPGAGPVAIGSGGYETGGTGASFGTRGGAGGDATTNPATAAPSPAVYGTRTLTTLEAGSGGGHGLASAVPGPCGLGGAGGGAIQLTSPSITIAGRVRASGGGGEGGRKCTGAVTTDASSGSGGGTGGAIYLEAEAIAGAGWLVANGGGGGGGGCVSCNPGTGGPGDNGHDDTTPATGGTSPLSGVGGVGATAAGGQKGVNGTNAGGGGGGAGRIFLAIPVAATVAIGSSPPAER